MIKRHNKNNISLSLDGKLLLDCFNSFRKLFIVFVPVNLKQHFPVFTDRQHEHWSLSRVSTVYSNTTTEKLETEEDKCEMLLCLIRNSHQSVFTADKHQTLQHDSNSSLQLTTDVLTAAMLGNQTRVLIKLQTDEQTCLTHHKSKQSSNTSISNNGSENQPKSEMSKTGLSCSFQTVRTRRTRRTRNHQTTTEQTKQTQ